MFRFSSDHSTCRNRSRKTRPRILRANATRHAVIPNPEFFRGEGPHNHNLRVDIEWSKQGRGILRCAQDDKAGGAARIGKFHPNPRQLLGRFPLGAVPAQSGRRQPRTLAGRGKDRFPLLRRWWWWLPWRFLIYDRGRWST